jgi:MarR family transcriptional regulator, organic hydroperoxide resistance regulator
MSMPGSRLQREIRQTKPFRSPSHEAVLALARTADIVRRSFNRLVETEGISEEQYNVLRILRGAGETGLPTLEIAARMVQQTPGITRLLDKLEKKRLVRRKRRLEDRRQVLCWITPDGLELLERLDEPADRSNIASMSALSAAEIRKLIELLDRVRAAHIQV